MVVSPCSISCLHDTCRNRMEDEGAKLLSCITCVVTQQCSVQKYGNWKGAFCLGGKERSWVIKLRLFQAECQMLRDLERAPWPQDTGKEKIAQGSKNQLAECCYQYWSANFGIKCAFCGSTWQWCEHLHLPAECKQPVTAVHWLHVTQIVWALIFQTVFTRK